MAFATMLNFKNKNNKNHVLPLSSIARQFEQGLFHAVHAMHAAPMGCTTVGAV